MIDGRLYTRDPEDDYHAANKQFVNAGLANKLDKTGGTISGKMFFNNNLYVVGGRIYCNMTPTSDTEVVRLVELKTRLKKPSGNPTEDSVVTVSSTGTPAYKKVSELVDTTSMQIITGAKVFADIPAVFRDTLGNNTETQFLSGSIMHKKDEAQYIFHYPSASGTVALTPSIAPTEPSVVVNAVDRTPTWKPLSEVEVSVPTRSQVDLLF